MPAVNLAPIFNAYQAFTNSGIPLAGGQLYTYLAGTSTLQATYTTTAGNVFNANPMLFNAAGRLAQDIWLDDTLAYKFILQDSLGNPIDTIDDIHGAEKGGAAAALAAALAISFTTITLNATTLTVSGNTVLGDATTDTLNVGAGGLIKDASGNVGIGITPAAKLDVLLASTNRVKWSESSSTYIVDSLNAAASAYLAKTERALSYNWFAAPAGTPTAGISLSSAGLFNIAAGSGAFLLGGANTRFESAPQTCPSSNFTISVPHGLPARQFDVMTVVLQCQIAEAGYSPSDEVLFLADNLDTTRSATWGSNGVNAYVVYTGANPPAIRNPTTFALVNLTAANWRVVIRGLWL